MSRLKTCQKSGWAGQAAAHRFRPPSLVADDDDKHMSRPSALQVKKASSVSMSYRHEMQAS